MHNSTIKNIRHKLIECAYKSNAGHIGSALSCVEILYSLYFNVANISKNNIYDENRDRIILSKGHGSLALYLMLAYKGIIPMNYLDKYLSNGGKLPCHIDMQSAPGLEASTGSLGHGLGLGEGFALANKMRHNNARIFVIMGDGEMQEGSVWEALNSISTLKLNNLVVIIDNNQFQASAATKDVTNAQNLKERLTSFGYHATEVDGHDVKVLSNAFQKRNEQPIAVIANTIKGKGCLFMENSLESHYIKIDHDRYKKYINSEEANETYICE